METKFYVDSSGNYIGGYVGVEPPKGSIEVPSAPDNASDKWVDGEWVADVNQWRESCTVRRAAFKLALEDEGLLTTVETAIQTAPKAMQIKWAEEVNFKRFDPDLVTFAKTKLNMADSEIDEVFKLAETK